MLGSIIWMGYRSWARQNPDFYWNKAVAAKDSGKPQVARIYLQNLLAKNPQHHRGHKLLAELYLEEARDAQRPATYLANPHALSHLAEAARLSPDDLELQKEVLQNYLSQRMLPNAALAAAQVIRREPDNADALFVLGWQAVQNKQTRQADEYLQQLRNQPTRNVFQTLALMVQNFESAGQDEEMQDALGTAARLAGGLTEEKYRLLSPLDLSLMPGLLQAGIQRAEDLDVAHERTLATLNALQTLCDGQLQPAGELASRASQVLMLLEARFPIPDGDLEAETERRQLAEKAETIRVLAISGGQDVPPLVYHQSAILAASKSNHQAALETLRQGLAAGAKLPDNRKKELLDLHLLAARQLVVLRQFAEAEEHLKVLISNPDSAGWGHLLSGSVAMHEGRLDQALTHFLQAKKQLGNTLLVRMALADVYLASKRWPEALSMLESLHVKFEELNPEQRAWAERHLGSRENVHFGQLQAHLATGHWQEARPHLEALKHTELEARAWAVAVAALWGSNDRDKSLPLLVDVRRRFPNDLTLLRLHVTMLQQLGQEAEVGPMLEQYAASAPKDLQAQLMLCAWLIRSGKSAAALPHLERVATPLIETPQDRYLVVAHRAQALLSLDRAAEAMELLEPLKDEPAAAAVAGVMQAAVEIRRRDMEAAFEALSEAQQSNPRSGVLGLLRSELAAQKGDFSTAVEALTPTLEVTALRDRAGMAMLRSLSRLASEQKPEAIEAKVNELLAKYPDNPYLMLARADFEFQRGQFEEGLRQLNRVEQMLPDSHVGPFVKAVAWLKKGKPERALVEAARALKIKPDHMPALVLSAQASLAVKNYSSVLDFTRTALERDPKLWQVWLLRVEALKQLNRLDEAALVLEKILEKQPKMAAAYLQLAQLYIEADQPQKALETYGRGHRELPDVYVLVTARIELLARTGQLAEAQKLAAESVADEPDLVRYLALCQAFVNCKQPRLAREWGNRALKIANPSHQPAVHLQLGHIALQQGSDPQALQEAREHFAAVLQASPRDLVAGNNLAWLLATKFNEPAQAVQIVETVRGNAPVDQMPVTFIDTMATVYRKANRPQDAETLLREAVALKPNDPRLLFQLGMVLSTSKEADAAASALQSALRLGLPTEEAAEAQRELTKLARRNPK